MRTRIPHLIAGSLTALVAAGFLAAGGGVLWLDGQRDDQGFVHTGEHEYTAGTAALRTDKLDFDGTEWLLDADDDYRSVRLRAESDNGKPLFVGIAKTDDVDRYLDGVSHTTLTDLDYAPFDADYRDERGAARRAGRPARQRIWAASATGRGTQDLRWKVKEGEWSIVVMNADGTPGVSADIDAGAKLPHLEAIGWTGIGIGGALLAVTGGLLVLGARPPRRGPGLGEPLPTAAAA